MKFISSLIVLFSINAFSAQLATQVADFGFVPNYEGKDLVKVVDRLNLDYKNSLKATDDDKSEDDKERDDKFDSTFCNLLNPGDKDNSNNDCSNIDEFAFVYDGYIVNNTCFETPDEAKNVAIATNACFYRPPAKSGYCELNRPGHTDRANRYCLDNKFYSISFDGFILNRECTNEIDKSLDKAIDSFICGIEPPVRGGNCEIMNPSQRDRGGLRCQDPHSYSVTRNGYIIDSVCFVTIEQAYAHMNRTYSCR